MARIPPHEAYAIRLDLRSVFDGRMENAPLCYFAGVASAAAGCGVACGVASGVAAVAGATAGAA
jgi:hypothetical protein